jgi:hypothetical protein
MNTWELTLGFAVNFRTLKEVLAGLKVQGHRWWIASDPADAPETKRVTIGYGCPECNDHLNVSYYRVPVIDAAVYRYSPPDLILLFDPSCMWAESLGCYREETGALVQSDLDDFGDFYLPVLRALWERIGEGRWCDTTRGDLIVGKEGR